MDEINEDNSMATPIDDKGRILPAYLSQEEKLDEVLAIARATQDLVERFLNDFMSGKIGGPMGMLGKLMGGGK